MPWVNIRPLTHVASFSNDAKFNHLIWYVHSFVVKLFLDVVNKREKKDTFVIDTFFLVNIP